MELIPLIFFIVVSLWVASRAIYSFLMISAHLDEVELPQWFMRGVSLIDFVVLLASLRLDGLCSPTIPFTGLLTQTAVLFVGFCIFYRFCRFVIINGARWPLEFCYDGVYVAARIVFFFALIILHTMNRFMARCHPW